MVRREMAASDSSYFPGDFRDQIMEHWGERGTWCPQVRSGHRCPDYGVLSDDQVSYYLWWRTQADEGVMDLIDEGYSWLYCREIIDVGGDPAEVMSRLRRFEDLCSKDYASRNFVAGVADEYALYAGMPLESLSFRNYELRDVALAVSLASYPIGTNGLLALPLFDWYRYAPEVGMDEMEEILHLSLVGIDEVSRSEGSALADRLGCDFGLVRFVPLSRFGRSDVVLDLPTLSRFDSGLNELADSIVRMASRLLSDDGRGPRVPKAFPESYRRAVAAAVDAVIDGEPFDPASLRLPGGKGYWGDAMVLGGRAGGTGSVIARQAPAGRSYPELEMDDVWAHMHDLPDPSASYVPSMTQRASYGGMDRRQLGFYIAWRHDVLEGRYGYTDEGYMRLLLAEVIALEEDPARTRAILEGIGGAYGLNDPAVADTLFSHALINGYDIPPVRVQDRYADATIYLRLASRPPGAFDMGMIRWFTMYGENYVSRDPRLYAEAFTEGLRAADGALEALDGRRLCDRGGRRRSYSLIPVYSEIWHRGRSTVRVEYRNVLWNTALNSIVEEIFKITIRTVNRRLGRSGPKAPSGIWKSVAAAVTEAVDGYMDRLERREAARLAVSSAASITFDSAAVEEAERDLMAVTGMMATEGDVPEEPPEPEPAPTVSAPAEPAPAGGWEAFASSLDPAERAFLSEVCAGGDGSAALRGTGIRPVQAEASINSKAMDAIGDAVMEDGEVYEEYVQDIRGVLRRRSPGAR